MYLLPIVTDCMVRQEKGRQGLQLMRASAKLLPAVIYYLGRQGCDTRQITGPVGGQDTRKDQEGGKMRGRNKVPEPQPLSPAAEPSRTCGGDLSQLGLGEPSARPLWRL